MTQQGKKYPSQDHLFNGRWMPGESRIKVGPANFSDMANYRPTDTGVEVVPGYSKINTTALTSHPVIKGGIQAINPISGDSRVLVQAENSGGTETAVYENQGSVPAQADFEATVLHTDDADAGKGRFCPAPGGEVVYANGRETLVYGSGAMPVRGFITSSAAVGDFASDAVDYTDAVNSDGDGSGEVAVLGGGGLDSYCKLLLHLDGSDGATTTTDSGPTGRTVTMTNAVLDTDQAVFGVSSCYFDGSGDYLVVPNTSPTIYFASSNLTIDFRARWATTPTSDQVILSRYTDANNYIVLFWDYSETCLHWIVMVSGTLIHDFESAAWTPTANTWYHIALVRGAPSVSRWTFFIDGTATGTPAYDSQTVFDALIDWHIGAMNGGSFFNGWLDEFRISAGVARWTADFTPPSAAYSLDRLTFAVITDRAPQGFTLTVADANDPLLAATWTGKTWNGNSWTDLQSLADGGSGLTDSGALTFTSTVGTAKPRYLEGYYGYCCQFTLSDGSGTISRVTVDAPMQPITDLWNGQWRTAIQFRYSIAGVEYDRTLDVAEQTPAGITSFANAYAANLHGLTTSDYVDIGFQDRTAAVRTWTWDRQSGYVNTTAATVTPHYWNGSEFVVCSGVIDGTDVSGDTLGQMGVISWTPPSAGQWFKKESKGVKLYFIRLKFSATLAGSTGVGIDMVQGISAPEQRLTGFDFPFFFQKRVFLVRDNYAHYCETDEPAFWNGDDSSFGAGRQPIKFGDGTPVRAAISIFNRFGSSLLFYAVVLKKKGLHLLSGYDADSFAVQDVSATIGIAAVDTLDAAEVAFKMDDTRRNLVAWLAYSGPIIFDAGTPIHVKGEVACYFDKDDSRCVNYGAIDTSWGILDPDTNTYHLGIPTGSATAPDVWLALDLVRIKWYRVVPAGDNAIPRGAIRVMDDDSAQYVYLLMADGRMLRLNHGATWDGEDIAAYIETGDFAPSGKFVEQTEIQRIALLMEAVSESDASVTVTHYLDGADSGTTVKAMSAYHATNKYIRDLKKFNKTGMCHRLRFASTTDAVTKGVPLIGWSMSIATVRDVGGG